MYRIEIQYIFTYINILQNYINNKNLRIENYSCLNNLFNIFIYLLRSLMYLFKCILYYSFIIFINLFKII